MFWNFVWRAVRFRGPRLGLAFAALSLASTLATVLFSLYSDIEHKLHREFRGYGANLVIAPAPNFSTVPLRAVSEAERLNAAAAPFRYSVGRLHGEPVALARVDFGRAAPLTEYWRIQGARVAGTGECLAGIRAAEHFRLAPGAPAGIEGNNACTVRGIVTTGGAEDNQILLPFEGTEASLVQVRAEGSRVEQTRAALSQALPECDVRILRAVAETEALIVLKVRSVLFLLSALILVITALCVMNGFSALVIERTKEIGMLKALGARDGRIAGLLISESALLAVAASITGYGLGLLAAWSIGRSIFGEGAGAGVNPGAILPVLGVTLGVATAATLASASRIWSIQPAATLRGE